MKDDVFFSVIMPIYNVNTDYLYAAFSSLEKQTYDNFELIIINDGADVETAEAIDNYPFVINKVTILKQDNQGQYLSRINGLKKAQGDYVFFFDSDDLLTSDAFDILNDIASTKKPDVIMYGLPRFFIDERDMKEAVHFFEEGPVDKNTVIREMVKLHCNNICSKCAKRELLSTDSDEIDGKLRNGEDLGQAAKLVLKADSFYYTKKDIYLYRDNQEKREYYDTRNIHNVNFTVPLYNEVFIKNQKYNEMLPFFKASVMNSVIYNSFLVCRFNNDRKEKYSLLDEMNKQEIVSILKGIKTPAPILSSVVFNLLTKRQYFFFDILSKLYPLN